MSTRYDAKHRVHFWVFLLIALLCALLFFTFFRSSEHCFYKFLPSVVAAAIVACSRLSVHLESWSDDLTRLAGCGPQDFDLCARTLLKYVCSRRRAYERSTRGRWIDHLLGFCLLSFFWFCFQNLSQKLRGVTNHAEPFLLHICSR